MSLEVQKIVLIWSNASDDHIKLARYVNAYDTNRMITCVTKETLVKTGKLPSYIDSIPALVYMYKNKSVSIIEDIEDIVSQLQRLLHIPQEAKEKFQEGITEVIHVNQSKQAKPAIFMNRLCKDVQHDFKNRSGAIAGRDAHKEEFSDK